LTQDQPQEAIIGSFLCGIIWMHFQQASRRAAQLIYGNEGNGGANGTRTRDLFRDREAL
jgi:hypothetical protein